MNVTLIGMGSGQPENLTLQGLAALRQADLILGARRLLAVLPAGCTENRAAAYRSDEVAELLQTSGAENAVLVYSGDTGFYSGASSMMEKLEALGVRARVLPGLSSIQLLAAALGLPGRWWEPLYLLAGAQAVLGCFNLLPIPPLDGAQMAACLYAVWNSHKNLAGND